jgi:hypothetical protein
LLSVDTEGCEWYALKNLKSRPKVISLETHGKYYTNAYIKEILNGLSATIMRFGIRMEAIQFLSKTAYLRLVLLKSYRYFLKNLKSNRLNYNGF